jgi:uncharacterized membrane protein YcjF (UPF0283 family)
VVYIAGSLYNTFYIWPLKIRERDQEEGREAKRRKREQNAEKIVARKTAFHSNRKYTTMKSFRYC